MHWFHNHESSLPQLTLDGCIMHEPLQVKGNIGQSLLEVAQQNDIGLEGACEGVMACSTCHCILSDSYFDTLEEACEDEEDMLDLAVELEETYGHLRAVF